MSEEIKTALRRFARVFLSTFLTSAFIFIEMFGGWNAILAEFQLSFKSGLAAIVNTFLFPLIGSCVAASLNAVGKLFRSNAETYKNKIEQFIGKIF